MSAVFVALRRLLVAVVPSRLRGEVFILGMVICDNGMVRAFMRVSMVSFARALLLASLSVSGVVSISGCAQLNQLQNKFPSSATTEKTEAASAQKVRETSSTRPAPSISLKQIVRQIENGEHDLARAELKTFLEKDPKNQAARNLLEQLTIDPAKTLGPAVSTYTVKPGDTLGGLAARFLGDPMNFIILGRYNDIKRGRDLQAGQTIQIPSLKRLEALPNGPRLPKADESVAAIPSVKSDTTQAAESPTPADGQAAPTAESKTATKPISPAEKTKALAAQQAGLAAMRKNQLEEAEEDFSRALAIDPSLEPSKTHLTQVRQKLVLRYHEAALVAYRKQHLDEAIAWWDKALALDPNYEPALGYRARALELKRRLEQLSEQ